MIHVLYITKVIGGLIRNLPPQLNGLGILCKPHVLIGIQERLKLITDIDFYILGKCECIEVVPDIFQDIQVIGAVSSCKGKGFIRTSAQCVSVNGSVRYRDCSLTLAALPPYCTIT